MRELRISSRSNKRTSSGITAAKESIPAPERCSLIYEAEHIEPETSKEIIESIENKEDAISDNVEPKQQKIMELDEYLRQQGLEGRAGDGDGNGGVKEETDSDVNYRFLIFALIVSTIAILLLVGAIMFLVKDKKENDKKLMEEVNRDESSNRDVTNDNNINKEISKSESKVLSNEKSKEINKDINKSTSQSINKVARKEKKITKNNKNDTKKKGQIDL